MTERNQAPDGSTPTLDDVLEKIRQQLKKFKGGSVLILAAAVVVVVVWTAWFIVQPEETGIVQRFGKVMRTAGPGLHFKLPYGIETVRLLPTARVLKEDPEFYAFLRTIESYKDRANPNTVLILTTDSDFYQYIKNANPNQAQVSSAP